jgi:tRNA(adenine34) deaminase
MREYMHYALAEAQRALPLDVPIGAVLIDPAGDIVAYAHNERERKQSVIEHAEIVAIRTVSASIGDWRLDGYTLVVTLEPCLMCVGAIIQARIERVVYGACSAESYSHLLVQHGVSVIGGICEDACSELLSGFFRGRR